MGIMTTYHGYNNPVYNAHKNVGVHGTWQNMVVFVFNMIFSVFSQDLQGDPELYSSCLLGPISVNIYSAFDFCFCLLFKSKAKATKAE